MKVIAIALVALVIAALACGCDPRTASETPAVAAAHSSADRGEKENPEPFTVILGPDKSLSTSATMVPPVTWAHLKGLLEYLAQTGGELALASIGSRSPMQPFRSVRIEAPLQSPAIPQRGNGTVYERSEALKAYRSASARHESNANERRERLAARIAEFRKDAEEILGLPADQRKTDIYGFLQGALVMASEDDPFRRLVFVVLVSDGLHDVAKQSPVDDMPDSVQLLVVNSTGATGSVGNLHPQRFATLGAAIRYIGQETGGGR